MSLLLFGQMNGGVGLHRGQQDFGELPALVDVDDIERVEIVRGPASAAQPTYDVREDAGRSWVRQAQP